MVGNHVRFLEARLGALLLNRTTRKQGVTEFGRSYYERCRVILAEIEAAAVTRIHRMAVNLNARLDRRTADSKILIRVRRLAAGAERHARNLRQHVL